MINNNSVESPRLGFGLSSEMSMVTSEQELWRAIKDRDSRYFASFVYGVKSTGVYCRPTCPSRKPRLDQLTFFENSLTAERNGFRACMRCNPDDRSAKSPQETLVTKICELIEENPEANLTLSDLSRSFGTSPFHLQRIFKQATGITPKEYVRAARIQKIKGSLKRGESIRKSIYDSGYKTSSWLYPRRADIASRNILGMAPSAYKSGGEGMRISYLISDSPIGRLLVAATQHGVCSVIIGNSNDKMIKILRQEFPRASIAQDEVIVNNLGTCMEKILHCIDEGKNLSNLGIPLDVIGTAFQHKVWKELQAIPIGEVRAYSDIAKKIGSPRGSRAVARACATNPVALVIPCHRVVRKNGDLGGYRWGIEKKQSLLKGEGVGLERDLTASPHVSESA
jgi:AraC family transcriptional regulator of adaptative response/methylated-DNA-[protein]-cysteine methyltransferase